MLSLSDMSKSMHREVLNINLSLVSAQYSSPGSEGRTTERGFTRGSDLCVHWGIASVARLSSPCPLPWEFPLKNVQS